MSKKNNVDMFAQIGAFKDEKLRIDLIEPQPPELPKKFLPLGKKRTADFSPAKKVDSDEKLKKQLQSMRKKYEKFLKNLSPNLKSYRDEKFLREFQYRGETKSDARNFSNVLKGMGKWEKVTVPHYGGPICKATTYYRCKFDLTKKFLNQQRQFVCFKAVDYKSQVFINGKYLGGNEGFFNPFEFDFTSVAKLKNNVLVVKVENDSVCMGNRSWTLDGHFEEGDKIYAATGFGWDEPGQGWSHCPPGMGICQDVYVQGRSDIFINDIFVRPDIENQKAHVWVEATNCNIEPEDISFELSIFGRNFKKKVFEDKSFEVPYAGPGVNYYKFDVDIKSAKIWTLDKPWLYQIHVKVIDSQGKCRDTLGSHFGMRSFTMDMENSPKGRMFFNGEPIKLRGANTMGHMQQCVKNKDFKQLIDDILISKIGNLNYFRLTQRPVQSEIYDYCDMLGMLTQTDLPLFGFLRRNQFVEAVKQSRDMERLIRSHPCNIMVSYINEPFPASKDKEQRHLNRSELEDFFTAASLLVHNANPDRVIKPVDGDYDPPAPGLPDNHCYCTWYNGHGVEIGRLYKGYWIKVKPDWVYGCGEFGTEGLDFVNVMKRYYPKDWMPSNKKEEKDWSPSEIYKSQTGDFHYLWFPTQHSLKDWVKQSHYHQYWGVKTMTEAFRRDNNMHSFAVHLLIDAFPSSWMKALVDFKRKPKPAFFAYKDALEPLMLNIRSDRDKFFSGQESEFEIWVCNDLNQSRDDLSLNYKIECDGEIVAADKVKADIEKFCSKFQGFVKFKMPEVDNRTKFKLTAGLVDKKGRTVSDYTFDFDVFAKPVKIEKKIYNIGEDASKLAKELNYNVSGSISGADVIIVSDYKKFAKHKKEVKSLLGQGGKLIFTALEEGKYNIFGKTVEIDRCGMGRRNFVDPNTGHEIVKEFEDYDFKMWYDQSKGYVSPFVSNLIKVNDFNPILTAGNGFWKAGPWEKYYAATESQFGKGKIFMCQLELLDRCQSNPVAAKFVNNMINY